MSADARVYAIGDVHGRRDLLLRLHDLIRDDIEKADSKRNIVVYLGDYVDRGPESAGVIDILAGHGGPGDETAHLKGNHEDFMLRFMDNDGAADAWLFNGGGETLESYGVDAAPLMLGDDPSDARRALTQAMPEHHRSFLHGLQLSHRVGDVLFVHAGIDPERPLDDQRDHDLMWIRETFLHATTDTGVLVVHGHTPTVTRRPEITHRRIDVDTGAWMSGRLTAAVLEHGRVRFLAT